MNIKMKHYIDPTIDFVFKILFGSVGNEPIVIHFLNSIVKPLKTITSATIKNPFNERKYKEDKLSVVDIKVEDQEHHTYQIEIQLTSPQYLKERMLLNWSQIYAKQIKKGEGFSVLKPVISIWLLTANIEDDAFYHHHYQLIDQQNHKIFSDHCTIHLLELNKWTLPPSIDGRLCDEDIWLFFFTNAHKWLELPPIANTSTMELAMAVLQHISDENEQYERYIARERYKMDRLSDKEDLEHEIEQRLKAERQAEEQSLRADEQSQRADDELKLRQAEQQRADEMEKQLNNLQQQMKELQAKK